MGETKHIHLIGICGTAMASLAGMLKQRGFLVSGSDAAAYPPMSDLLAELGIPVAQPFDAGNLEPPPDMVVVGNAISRGNCELEHVLDRRIPFCSLPQLLQDEFLRGKEVLVVAGTHDTFTPYWLSEEMHDRIPGAEMLTVPGGTHVSPIEQPELLTLRLEKWLAGIQPTRLRAAAS